MKRASLIAVTVLGASILGNAAVSANALTDAANDRTTTSKSSITFTQDEDPKPTPPGPTPDPTPTPGPLTLDAVSSFEFGEHKTVAGDAVYALPKLTADNGYNTEADGSGSYEAMAQVTDHRVSGGAKGWTLSVSADKLAADDSGTKYTIGGAVINLPKTSVKGFGDFVGDAPSSDLSQITLDGTAVTVMSAKADSAAGAGDGNGVGTWDQWMGTGQEDDSAPIKDTINLTIPKDDMAKNVKEGIEYTSTLTWTLNDTPGV